ncbi:hypothetical protein HOC01_01665 [archaeon]|jgi:hypothetical protein|nr:hypothetical protein [archaeon]MBT6697973.1 hypothetical protein [archaeon]
MNKDERIMTVIMLILAVVAIVSILFAIHGVGISTEGEAFRQNYFENPAEERKGERAIFKASPMWEDEKVIVLHSMIE